MHIQLIHNFADIISIENLLAAWQEFLPGKRNKPDVQQFQLQLMDNILQLHTDLANKMYKHSDYEHFRISDPKPRNIHKASVRDRLLHHAVYRILYPFFDKTFIADSYSCRLDKGTHKAIERFADMHRKVSCNNSRTCWVLQCDIKQFFASIDQRALLDILRGYIPDVDVMWLLGEIIESFHADVGTILGLSLPDMPRRGLPLGNLTSQLFVNIYMNEFDKWVKYKLKAKYYIRYADDFVLLSDDRELLQEQLVLLRRFLDTHMHLTLHPHKVSIATLASGIDFLGWVHFPDHRVLRTAIKHRMLRRLQERAAEDSLQSYLGLLNHGVAYELQKTVSLLATKN